MAGKGVGQREQSRLTLPQPSPRSAEALHDYQYPGSSLPGYSSPLSPLPWAGLASRGAPPPGQPALAQLLRPPAWEHVHARPPRSTPLPWPSLLPCPCSCSAGPDCPAPQPQHSALGAAAAPRPPAQRQRPAPMPTSQTQDKKGKPRDGTPAPRHQKVLHGNFSKITFWSIRENSPPGSWDPWPIISNRFLAGR
jgi:hypothetical protein